LTIQITRGTFPTMHMLTEAELDANRWAACGHASLAALLGRPLDEVRDACPVRRGVWMNLVDMQRALTRLGVSWHATPPAPPIDGLPVKAWPVRGLVLIQFRGSWDRMPPTHPAQLQRSHWIAVAPKGDRVGDAWLSQPGAFDVNLVFGLEKQGGWTSRAQWEQHGGALIASQMRGATGAWWVRAGIEVDHG
jgi:hypothetical protein